MVNDYRYFDGCIHYVDWQGTSSLYVLCPLKAHPLFYIGTALLIVGSWFGFFGWIKIWFEWKKENPNKKMPLGVLGTFVNFTIWLTCSIPVAYSVLVLLTPWSMGLTNSLNVPLTRMLFWMFGHPLVYFWLLPAYIMFYTVLPKVAGSKLYSENAGRLAFLLFLVLSIPIGVHHQFSEPVFSPTVKLYQSIMTFGVAIPSFMTAFNIAATLEYGARRRGNKSLMGWVKDQPYFQKKNFLFGYLICGLIIFVFGGLSGIVNASYSLNSVVHNTAWVPGHFHMTVAGPVLLAILGMSIYMYSHLSGKPIKNEGFVTICPYLWMIGIMFFSHGLMAGGLMGEPRRTNMGLSYTNPESPLYNPHWVFTATIALIGGIIMTTAAVLYFIAFYRTALGKKVNESELVLPEFEELHEEKPVSLLLNMKPWLVVMVLLIFLSYIPALMSVFKYSAPVKNKFNVESPVNLISSNKDQAK
ncbi:cytochrome C oxidase subunit I [Rhizosphaericola mali]|uniref:Cytochrome C oxidase subunit I n=1 Tax=Rhizosphaericola mali TaxID=2545455 RepID=A0A5P2G3Q3_9BACT|nr:cytochrome C oxidase subunit I [Rhizosphaericola mali]